MTTFTEETDPLCIAPSRAAELLSGAPWRRFAVVGDSLSAGTGDPSPGYSSLGWADRVADVMRRVNPDLAYQNTAAIGARSADVLSNLPATLGRFRPDLVHVPSGANDFAIPEPDFASIQATLAKVYGQAAQTGAQLFAFTLGRAYVVPGFHDWGQRVRRINEIVRGLAVEHDVVLIDMWAHPVNERPALLSADRIHFSTLGQAVMAAEVLKALAQRAASSRCSEHGR